MIHYMLRQRARNEEALRALRGLAKGEASDQARKIEQHATAIANAMAALHGGDWRVQIDHLTGYVLVRRN